MAATTCKLRPVGVGVYENLSVQLGICIGCGGSVTDVVCAVAHIRFSRGGYSAIITLSQEEVFFSFPSNFSDKDKEQITSIAQKTPSCHYYTAYFLIWEEMTKREREKVREYFSRCKDLTVLMTLPNNDSPLLSRVVSTMKDIMRRFFHVVSGEIRSVGIPLDCADKYLLFYQKPYGK